MGFCGSCVCVLSLQLLSIVPVALSFVLPVAPVVVVLPVEVPLVTVAVLLSDEPFVPLAVPPVVTSVENAGMVNNTRKTKHKALLNILITFCNLIEKPRKQKNTLGMPPLFLSAFNLTCILEACLFWLVPKLGLGNAYLASSCLAVLWEAGASKTPAKPADYRHWPGFRHPCRNDGFSRLPGLVCNDENGTWERANTAQLSLHHF